MIVYSLTGKSGTGKSYHAMQLCQELGIDAIIDDGLFIYKNKIEAGHSAKRETTKVGALRAAVFTREEHRAQVRSRIRACHPAKILVLGTSDAMADKICEQLDLPRVSTYIHIEDITTESDREAARRSRFGQGEHVIPVPTMQLRRQFSGYFMNPLNIFRDRREGSGHSQEKTVVRPTYSYLGNFYISDAVITDIAKCVAAESDVIEEVDKVHENLTTEALCLTVGLRVRPAGALWEAADWFQHRFAEQVQAMTAFNVVKVDVVLRSAARP